MQGLIKTNKKLNSRILKLQKANERSTVFRKKINLILKSYYLLEKK